MPDIKLIAAIDSKRGIAAGQKSLWHIPTDHRYFLDMVKEGPVVMGWNTFEAYNFKPFGNGSNTVLTRRDIEAVPGIWIVHDAQTFFRELQSDIWVVGGGKIYNAAMPFATKLYITQIEGDFNADIFFPKYDSLFHRTDNNKPQTENGITFTFQIWERKL